MVWGCVSACVWQLSLMKQFCWQSHMCVSICNWYKRIKSYNLAHKNPLNPTIMTSDCSFRIKFHEIGSDRPIPKILPDFVHLISEMKKKRTQPKLLISNLLLANGFTMLYELCRIIFWTIYSYQSYVAMNVSGCYSLGARCLSAVYVTVYVGGNCMCVIQFCTAFNIIVTQVSCIFMSPCLKLMFVKQLFDSIFGPWQTLCVHVYMFV